MAAPSGSFLIMARKADVSKKNRSDTFHGIEIPLVFAQFLAQLIDGLAVPGGFLGTTQSFALAYAMISESGAFFAPSVDQCAASNPASASTPTQRGERFISTSNFMR